MDTQALRRLAEAIPLPHHPSDLEALRRGVEDYTGRPLWLEPITISGSELTGLLLRSAELNVILYRGNTSLPHQRWIIGHEIGHLVIGHRLAAISHEELLAIVAGLSRHTIPARLDEIEHLNRDLADDLDQEERAAQEREAEEFTRALNARIDAACTGDHHRSDAIRRWLTLNR